MKLLFQCAYDRDSVDLHCKRSRRFQVHGHNPRDSSASPRACLLSGHGSLRLMSNDGCALATSVGNAEAFVIQQLGSV